MFLIVWLSPFFVSFKSRCLLVCNCLFYVFTYKVFNGGYYGYATIGRHANTTRQRCDLQNTYNVHDITGYQSSPYPPSHIAPESNPTPSHSPVTCNVTSQHCPRKLIIHCEYIKKHTLPA